MPELRQRERTTARRARLSGAPASAARKAVLLTSAPPETITSVTGRVQARGKFLAVDGRKFWVKGVTYGTFRENSAGEPFPEQREVAVDFARMAENGINTVRVYTPSPRWLLDLAGRAGLRVMVGLPWEQHVAFLDDRARAAAIVRRVRATVRELAHHPAILCYAVGNEIPASIVRWHGRRPIEQFIEKLYRVVKSEDPDALVTYVNYPTTEYLRLPFLDLIAFNVYLESEERLSAYLARLQNLAGERPLVLAELGLDSRRNGAEQQAQSLRWQLRTTIAAGCAGAMVFGWTDEWFRGGHDIDDWDFGLTTREREPKPALATVREVFAHVPFAPGGEWPTMSVVVCTHNGSRTIRDTLEALRHVEYPHFEVIIVDDGSTDDTAEIARGYEVTLIRTENRGLSSARNTGWQTARGEIVAYIDDDAYPDPHWLLYLAYAFMTTSHAGVGGYNIAPPGDGPIAECVANAPGGPVHVLLTDTEAEHIPGCNMAFRRKALEAIGGFDPRYRAAGDDVDLCWRLMEHGETIGFHAGAMDWHHRRNSVGMYWRQQKGYGKAEALLEEKWPTRYNAIGHVNWSGRLYGRGFTEPLPLMRARIYQGTWGTAAYQSLYEHDPGTLLALPLMPEWYLMLALLGVLAALGAFWMPLAIIAWPLLALGVAAPVGQAIIAAMRARFPDAHRNSAHVFGKRVLTAILHLMQPAARLIGRLQHGLTPWRLRGTSHLVFPSPRACTVWSERWRAAEQWVREVEAALLGHISTVFAGGNFDSWDLRIRGGLFGGARCQIAVEEHGAGKQLVRMRVWAYVPGPVLVLLIGSTALALLALHAHASVAAAGVGFLSVALFALVLRDAARAFGACTRAMRQVRTKAQTNA